MLSNPNNSFDQNILLNNTLNNVQEEQSFSPQSNPNTQVHNIQVHNSPNLINNPRLTKCIKRTTYTEEITLLEPL
ncbi:3457_t:CDS:1, partial [Funneliformis geosporum]